MKLSSGIRLGLAIVASVAAIGAVSACKTSNSDTKNLPVEEITAMTEQQWLDACNAELATPQTAAQARADLMKLANSDSCQAAYPIIRDIYDHYKKPMLN